MAPAARAAPRSLGGRGPRRLPLEQEHGAGGLALGQLTAPPTAAAWAAIGALAVVSTAVAFVVFLRGLRTLGAVRTAIVSTVEPFWTTLLAAAALDQPLRLSTVAGGALIAGAVLLLQRQPARAAAA